MKKNKYFIYNTNDVIELLEQSNIIFIEGEINNRQIQPGEYVIKIEYNSNRDCYKISTGKAGYVLNYFWFSIDNTIDFIYKNRKYYNDTIRKYQ